MVQRVCVTVVNYPADCFTGRCNHRDTRGIATMNATHTKHGDRLIDGGISTICRTKRGYYGRMSYGCGVKLYDTVRATVKHIGQGFITVKHVTWAINMQLTDTHEHLTEAQVARCLRQMVKRNRRLTHRGHGVYRLA
jgi:hypothetical protein